MKYRLFIGLAIILVISGFVVRSLNSHHADKLAASLVATDSNGTDLMTPNSDAASLQTQLTSYVHAHMGAHVTYTLKGSYDRALAAAQAAAAAQTANSQIYAAAQAACGGKTDSITQAKCNQAYLSQHLTAQPTPTQVDSPVLATYTHSLVAPFWTPDPAGALFAGALVAFVAGIITFRQGKRS